MPYKAFSFRHLLIVLCAAFLLGACAHTSPRPDDSLNVIRLEPEDSTESEALVIDLSKLDFSRYNNPAACERAVFHSEALARGRKAGTTQYRPENDTLSTLAISIGRLCAKELTVETTEPNQLFFYLRLALIIGEDDDASEAVERRISLMANDQQKGQAMYESIIAYTQSKPMRLKPAEDLLRKLDKLDHSARIYKIQAHHVLLSHYYTVFDTLNIRQSAEAIIRESKFLADNERNQWAYIVQAPYLYMTQLIAVQQDPQAALQYINKVRDSLFETKNMAAKNSLERFMARINLQANLYGQSAPPLEATLVVNDSAGAVRPVLGKVSMFVTFNLNCSPFCTRQYEVVKRLNTTYEPRGLQVTFISKTQGFSFPPGVQRPAEEMDTIASEFKSLDLPGALFIQLTQFRILPDKRRIPLPSSFEQQYAQHQAVIIDRKGFIRWLGNIDQSAEAVLRVVLNKVTLEN